MAQISDKTPQILELWRYVSENASKIDWNMLQRDVAIIRTYSTIENLDAQHGLSDTGLIYKQIFLLFKKINPNISFTLKVGIVPITDLVVIQKIKDNTQTNSQHQAMFRYEIILSADGNSDNFPLIEQIYEESKKFLAGNEILDNLIVIKYYPQQPVPMFRITFKNVLLGPTVIKYRIQKIGNEQLDIVFTVDDKIVKQHVTTQQDVYLLRNAFCVFLESLVGEFVVAAHIPRITALPETPHNITYPTEVQYLKPLMSIVQDLTIALPTLKKCEWCQLNENHVELKETGGKNYCPYCFGCAGRLGIYSIQD